MDEELDLITMQDDEGNEITMEVMDYFFYEGQEYAVLVEYDEDACEACEGEGDTCSCGCCHDEEEGQHEAYIMRVVPVGDDQEEFVPVEDELLPKLIDFVQNDLYGDEDEVEEGEEEEEFEDAEDPEEEK